MVSLQFSNMDGARTGERSDGLTPESRLDVLSSDPGQPVRIDLSGIQAGAGGGAESGPAAAGGRLPDAHEGIEVKNKEHAKGAAAADDLFEPVPARSVARPAAEVTTFEPDPKASELLERMREGDRTAVAEFIELYGARIRRRIRAKLSPSMRRMYDAQEMMSTLTRRLDSFVSEKRLHADSPGQFWALVNRISTNALIDKARVMKRLNAIEGADGPLARAMVERINDAQRHSDYTAEIELDWIMESISDDRDRQILALWLHDLPHNAIAEHMGMTAPAVRKRWQIIRDKLRERLAPHMRGGGRDE